MSLISREPPYLVTEIESIAQALAKGTGMGMWLSSKEAIYAFHIPFFSRDWTWKIGKLEQGAVYLFEFAPVGEKYKPTDVPKFTSCLWLDQEHARKVLHRCRELEFMFGHGEVPTEEEVDLWVNSYDLARQEQIPELKKRLGMPA